VADWEDMVREHLVAYLDGLWRRDIDRNREIMRPEKALLHGEFVAEGIWEVGSEITFHADLDGDGNDEIITFRIDFHGYWLRVFRHGSGLSLTFPEQWRNPFSGDTEGFGTFQIARVIHLAVKDGTNRLLSRDAVRALGQLREYHRFYRGMVEWIGFRSVILPYTPGRSA